MLYIKNQEKNLDQELFRKPTSEYRGAPFWAWNASLEQEELKEQIEIFREMGFGGFHMHVRQGLETPYLSEEFLDAVECCVGKAKEEKMLAWLYDEDRWPSGYAGGFVTKHKKYRQKYLLMTKQDRETTEDFLQAYEEGLDYFLGAFDVTLDKDGKMVAYERVARENQADNKWYYFICTQQGGEPRYNYQSYVDVMSEEAVDVFLHSTYEAYEKRIGSEFGKTVPAIFTDEPMLFRTVLMESGFSEKDAKLPWTKDFSETYEQQFHENLEDCLPELFFDTEDGHAKVTKYQYYRHVSERFAKAYMDRISKWCAEKGILFTGHMMGEDSLNSSVGYNGDVMRMYKEMQLPGIDMLFNKQHYVTAKQCQSVVRQYGKEGMLSELYGVTGWDFDFRGHKFQGDWQACLGVTVRVPHLAWQTMKGEGKRDYPASIFYQSPWYKEYRKIEDHFARINTAMTRGKACVSTAVLHPVESFWLLCGSKAETSIERHEMEEHFKELAEWLLTGSIDFDYLSEVLLEDACSEGGNPLCVGKMKYETIIVADCVTLRPHTIRLLKEFKNKGGNLIFIGKTPYMSLARPSDEVEMLVQEGLILPYSRSSIYDAMATRHDVTLRYQNGYMTEHLMYQLREDGEDKWLFVANTEKPELAHVSKKQEIRVTVKGIYEPFLYNTLTGEVDRIAYRNEVGETHIFAIVYNNTSLLIKLEKRNQLAEYMKEREELFEKEISVFAEVEYGLEEPNVLLLDMAEFSVDDGPLQPTEEMMRIDDRVRKELHLTSRRFKVVQPWVIKNTPEDHKLKLVFHIESQINYQRPLLAIENPDKATIVWNDEKVATTKCGYYVDKYIHTVSLPELKCGENILEIEIPFGLKTDLECCYLLGHFGTCCVGRKPVVTSLPKKLQFGSIVNQGLAFYSGNVKYHTQITLKKLSDVEIEISHYRGATIKVLLDGEEKSNIAYAPYKTVLKNVSAGSHEVTYICYGNRYNTFAALHSLVADQEYPNITPDFWRSEGQEWSYEYQFRPMGILKTPIMRVREK